MALRREYRWKNQMQIGDAGAYEPIPVFEPKGKAKVLKHSIGIEDFGAVVLARMQKNRGANA